MIFSKFYARRDRNFSFSLVKRLLLGKFYEAKKIVHSDTRKCFPSSRCDPTMKIEIASERTSSWIGLVLFLSSSISMMTWGNLLSNIRVDLGKRKSILTRTTISGAFKSNPPASLMPHASAGDRRCNVTPNSWYDWLIVSPHFRLIRINPRNFLTKTKNKPSRVQSIVCRCCPCTKLTIDVLETSKRSFNFSIKSTFAPRKGKYSLNQSRGLLT